MSNSTRRDVVRRSFLFAMCLALGKLDALKASGGQLTVDLNQWATVVVQYRGRTIHIPVDVPPDGEKVVTYTVKYTW